MPRRKKNERTELEQSDYGALMVKALHQCMKLNEFTADDLYRFALELGVEETEIARLSGALLKRYQSQGFYIRKSKRFKLSERSSNPLPIWITSRKIRQVQ